MHFREVGTDFFTYINTVQLALCSDYVRLLHSLDELFAESRKQLGFFIYAFIEGKIALSAACEVLLLYISQHQRRKCIVELIARGDRLLIELYEKEYIRE